MQPAYYEDLVEIQNKYWDSAKIVFLDNDGWWIINESNQRVFHEIGDINKSRNNNFKYQSLFVYNYAN